jgi:serine/threonine protein kinase
MPMSEARWKTITPSQFSWEREALEFIRERLPDRDPYYAWSNFEFLSDNGSISEVDLLVLTPQGFYLIEIKSRPGSISGNSSTWNWRYNGTDFIDDNPILLANRKAKKLASLLKGQSACRGVRFPYIEPLIFCSHPENQLHLLGSAKYGVCLRDKAATENRQARKGIVSALINRDFEGANEHARSFIDRSIAKSIIKAMEQAGIQPSHRSRRVGDYVLGKVIYENPTGTYQDWEATHTSIKTSARRIRIYNLSRTASDIERESIRRAARREYQLLEALNHPGILRIESFTEHELGPALVFRHDPNSMRLDHFLSQYGSKLNVDIRLALLRQIAESIKYAHEKRIIHRALSPQNILITDAESDLPRTVIFNWHIGFRNATTSTTRSSTGLLITLNPENLIEDASTVYMAPEAINQSENLGEYLDIFSLGAIAYYLFSGQPPATNALDLMEKIRSNKGLQISAVIDGAGTQLQELIQYSTHPEVITRWDNVSDFLAQLDDVEEELTRPDTEREIVTDPSTAKSGDLLPGGFLIRTRLGSGSSAVTFLVEKDGKEIVLKLANSSEQNERIREEFEVIKKLRHQNIIEAYELFDFGDLVGFTMQKATDQRASIEDSTQHKRLEGTLAHRIKLEGRLHLELLQRFGEELLEVVRYLEDVGIHHRDIKPDNIGIRQMGRGDMLRLILFDFSLSRTPIDNIRAGTIPYLDPFISLRKPPRWDLTAERFSVAMTLYEMATGTLPKWGDGQSNPEVLDCEVMIRSELFDPQLRESMTAFFKKALKRNYKERFDNASEMLRAWRDLFREVEAVAVAQKEINLDEAIRNVTLNTEVNTLGLSTRALNALDRLHVITISDLLSVPLRRVYRMAGVGSKTRNEIKNLVNALRVKFPEVELLNRTTSRSSTTESSTSANEELGFKIASVDLIARQVGGFGIKSKESKQREILHAFLDWNATSTNQAVQWLSQVDVAKQLGITRQRVSSVVTQAKERWRKNQSINALRNTIAEFIKSSGGAMTVAELSNAILAAHGSSEEEPLRSQYAMIVTRVAVEAESLNTTPRFMDRRIGKSLIIVNSPAIAEYIEKLGRRADSLVSHDKLPAPARVIESLRDLASVDELQTIPDNQLIKLAVAASQKAALSSRMEIYPIGMTAVRALQLAYGALLGTKELTVSEIHNRVHGRYPEAEKLPDRPALDQLLATVELGLHWNPHAGDGNGAYQAANYKNVSGISTASVQSQLTPTSSESSNRVIPEIGEVKIFESKLKRAEKEGAFLALSVSLNRMLEAERRLLSSFDLEKINLDQLLIQAMQQQAEQARVNWSVVLRADAAKRDSADWRNLMILINRTIPLVEEKLTQSNRTILLCYPGLLARYDRLDLIERIRDRISIPGSSLHGLWLLLPSDDMSPLPMLDGKAVPVISAGQWARIPLTWIDNNLHLSEANR